MACACVAVLLAVVVPARADAQADTTAHPVVSVHLRDGSVIVGILEASDSAHVVLQTDAMGRVSIARDKVATIAGAHSRFSEPSPIAMEEIPTTVFTPPVEAKRSEWRTTLKLGVNYSSGTVSGVNGQTRGGEIGLAVERMTDRLSIQGEITGEYLKTDPNPESMNNVGFTLIVKRMLDSAFALRAETVVDHDEVDELDYRVLQSFGLAWTAVGTSVVTFILTPGLGYTAEKGQGPVALGLLSRSKFTNDRGVAGAESEALTVHIAPGFTLTQDLLWYHAFDDRPRLQYEGNAMLLGQVNEHVGMTLTYKREFDSEIPSPINKTRERIVAGLQFSW